jgi:hypothetical protein
MALDIVFKYIVPIERYFKAVMPGTNLFTGFSGYAKGTGLRSNSYSQKKIRNAVLLEAEHFPLW